MAFRTQMSEYPSNALTHQIDQMQNKLRGLRYANPEMDSVWETTNPPDFKSLLYIYGTHFKELQAAALSRVSNCFYYKPSSARPSQYAILNSDDYWAGITEYKTLPASFKRSVSPNSVLDLLTKSGPPFYTEILHHPNNKTGLNIAKNCYEKEEGTVRLKALEMALQKSTTHNISIFLHRGHFLTILTSVWTPKLECELVTLLPGIFNWTRSDSALMSNAELLAIQEAVLEESEEKYLKRIETLFESKLPKEPKITSAGLNTLKTKATKRLTKLTRDLNNCSSSIDRYEAEIKKLYKTANETRERIWFYQNAPEDDLTEFKDYIEKHPNVIRLEGNGDSITVIMVAPLINVDLDAAETMLKRAGKFSSWYTFLKICTLPERFEYTTWSAIKLSLVDNTYITIYTHGERPSSIPENIPHNPHLGRFRCLGNNLNLIISAMANENLIGAVESCVMAAKGLNLYDSTVIEYFKSSILKDRWAEERNILDKTTNTFYSLLEVQKIFELEEKDAEINAQKAKEAEKAEEEKANETVEFVG